MSKTGTIEKEKLLKMGQENRGRKFRIANSNILEHYKKTTEEENLLSIRTFLNTASFFKKKSRKLTANKSKQDKIIKIKFYSNLS